MSDISPAKLALWQAQGFDFLLLDVRRAGVRDEHGHIVEHVHQDGGHELAPIECQVDPLDEVGAGHGPGRPCLFNRHCRHLLIPGSLGR